MEFDHTKSLDIDDSDFRVAYVACLKGTFQKFTLYDGFLFKDK